MRQIFDRRIAGLGATLIAQELNDMGALFRGRLWQKASVLRLLANEALVGRIVFNRKATGHIQPAEG
jgi:hypothetical protein